MKKKSTQLVRGHGFGTAPVFAWVKAQTGWLDICLYREQKKIDGPVFPGMDTHALSVPGISPKPKPKENRHK